MKKILKDWYLKTSSPYVPIPSADFTTGYNRAQTGLTIAGQLRNSDVGGGTDGVDIVLTTNFTGGLSINAMNGTTTPYRLTNASDILVSTTTKGFATIGDHNKWIFQGKDAATPLRVGATNSGAVGWDWLGQTGGANLTIQNAVIEATIGNGFKANDGTNPYGTVDLSFVRIITSGTENFYIGSTLAVSNGFSLVNIVHCLGLDAGWDPIQVGHADSMYISNSTFYNGGLLNTSGQDHAMQFVDVNGLVEFSIFGGQRAFNISTHGIVIADSYIEINDATETGFIGRTDNLSYYPTSRHNGEPILFLRCKIKDRSGSSSGALVQVAERIADVEFRDCVFDTTKSTLYNDTRVVGYTNNLIGTLTTNGNSIGSIPIPTFMSTSQSDYETHGLLTSTYHLDLGLGYRTSR